MANADKLTERRVRGAKLGMTVQPKKKTPYDKLSERMMAGAPEQERLERRPSGYQIRSQRRIPRAKPGVQKDTTKA